MVAVGTGRPAGWATADDKAPATLVRLFLSLNIGDLVARHVLAPTLAWDDAAERAAIAAVFMHGAGRPAA
ncbi:MAG: hypothetical protein QM750_19145 [Rubrivivax sp.]